MFLFQRWKCSLIKQEEIPSFFNCFVQVWHIFFSKYFTKKRENPLIRGNFHLCYLFWCSILIHSNYFFHFKNNKGNAKCGVSPRLKIRPCELLRSKYVPSLVKIHWRMLILVFTRMLHSKNLTWWHWPWKSIVFQTLLRTKYVPSLVKIHWRILILVFTRMLCGKYLTRWPWPMTLKINRVPDSPKD